MVCTLSLALPLPPPLPVWSPASPTHGSRRRLRYKTHFKHNSYMKRVAKRENHREGPIRWRELQTRIADSQGPFVMSTMAPAMVSSKGKLSGQEVTSGYPNNVELGRIFTLHPKPKQKSHASFASISIPS